MFLCECGGVLLVKNVSKYPEGLSSDEKMEYMRKCTVECVDCKKIYEDKKYD